MKDPSRFVEELKCYKGIISPDFSCYRDAPLVVQAFNTYRNRAVGSFLQRQGIYVIPQVRWGSEDTYTTDVFNEKLAFLGVEKSSIVAI